MRAREDHNGVLFPTVGRLATTALAALCLLGPSPAQAEWTLLTSGTTSRFYGVYFVDTMTGYAVGVSGIIYKTTDGGTMWTDVKGAGNNAELHGVHFPVDASTGYVVGAGGAVFKTVDGGTNWTSAAPSTASDLWGIHFFDDQIGYVSGAGGAIFKTENGGTDWTDLTPAFSATLHDLCFPGEGETGYTTGYVSGYALKSTDAGVNWGNLGIAGQQLYAVDFPLNATTGFISGSLGYIAKTENGGTSWSPQNPRNIDMLDLHFPVDTTTGYAVGNHSASDIGQIVKTADGGATWDIQYPPTANGLRGVHFLNERIGYAVGDGGTILKTTDGGGNHVALHPTGLGATHTFSEVPAGCTPAEAWKCVNDQTGDVGTGLPEANEDTSYVLDDNNQTNRVMYSLDNGTVPAGATVSQIELRAYVSKGGPGPDVSLLYQRTGGQDATPIIGPVESIGGGSSNLISNTWTCLNWPGSDIDDLEIGLDHLTGGDTYLEQIYVLVNYEYDAVNYRSIGTQTADLYNAGTASVAQCAREVTFAGGSGVPITVGLGDKLSIGVEDLYILSRDSASQVTLQQGAAGDHSGVGFSIKRAYNTLQDWETNQEGNLVSGNRREVGVCYNDATGPFTAQLVISGSTTDADHYMHLTVAEGHRHNGLWETGARIDAQGGFGAGIDAITVEDEYTRIEWLEVLDIEADYADAIFFDDNPPAHNGLVANVSVHQFWQGFGNAAVRVEANNVTIRNLFATGGTSHGIYLETGSASIENCTLIGNAISGAGIKAPSGDVAVKNTISVDHGTRDDIYIETAGAATISYFGYNMFDSHGGGFDPATYQGGNQTPPADPEDLFISLGSPYDLHLEPAGHDAANNGVDLSLDFSNDIDGESRTGGWDIGADEAIGGGGAPPKPKIVRWSEVEPN